MPRSQLYLLAGIVSAVANIASAEICVSETKTFTAHMDLHASELGDWVFEECGLHHHNPTIAMEVGETYTFIQKDRTNYFHRTSPRFLMIEFSRKSSDCSATPHVGFSLLCC